MLEVHYNLLHKLAKGLNLWTFTVDPAVKHMEEDPDAYLASMLNLINKAFKERRGSAPLHVILDPADYPPHMKKMRKLLDQNPGEYVPKHTRASHEQ